MCGVLVSTNLHLTLTIKSSRYPKEILGTPEETRIFAEWAPEMELFGKVRETAKRLGFKKDIFLSSRQAELALGYKQEIKKHK